MGTAHLRPHGTRSRWNEIADYREQHISTLDLPDNRWEAEDMERAVIRAMTDRYSFKKVRDDGEWIHNGRGVDEKVIAETRHGVELRVKYHPQGSKYYFLVVTTGEFCEENLALSHLDKYNKHLRKTLKQIYGTVLRRTGRWTSTEVEV